MFSHIFIGTNRLDEALRFYRPLMDLLGWPEKFVDTERGWAVWTSAIGARPFLIVGRPFDGDPAVPGNGQMTAFLSPSRAIVDSCHAMALANGGALRRSTRAPSLVSPQLLWLLRPRSRGKQALLYFARGGDLSDLGAPPWDAAAIPPQTKILLDYRTKLNYTV
jgi:catechol 2,3-dioxygenase-like lactoylglutathione lyase family enzyme